MEEPERPVADISRIDRWLFAVRLAGSRTLASQAVGGGKVHVNGQRVKPAHRVRVGDRVSLRRGALEFECEVRALPPRRGPAREASLCYLESPASRAAREAFGERMRLGAAAAPRPAQRPDKHGRQRLRRLKGRI